MKHKMIARLPGYIQFLHGHALISLSLYYAFFANNKQADFEAFWHKDGFLWLN